MTEHPTFGDLADALRAHVAAGRTDLDVAAAYLHGIAVKRGLSVTLAGCRVSLDPNRPTDDEEIHR